MEADDVLADDMKVGRPVFFIQLARLIGVVAKAGDVVGQRVDPHIDDMAVVKIDGDAPLEGGAGDAQVGQPRLDKVVDHFGLA